MRPFDAVVATVLPLCAASDSDSEMPPGETHVIMTVVHWVV